MLKANQLWQELTRAVEKAERKAHPNHSRVPTGALAYRRLSDGACVWMWAHAFDPLMCNAQAEGTVTRRVFHRDVFAERHTWWSGAAPKESPDVS